MVDLLQNSSVFVKLGVFVPACGRQALVAIATKTPRHKETLRKTILRQPHGTGDMPKGKIKRLDSIAKNKHLNQSDVVREALRQYFSIQEFRRLRTILVPRVEQQGFCSDGDVFRKIS